MTQGLSAAEVEVAVTAASLAPSVLNVQPWLFRHRDGLLELHLDRTRRLPALDPDERAVTTSCGAALHNLVLALQCLGRACVVDLAPCATRSAAPGAVPDPAPDLAPDRRSTLLAVVRAAGSTVADSDAVARFQAVPRRRTSRVPFLEAPLPRAVLRRLEAAAEAEGAVLHLLDEVEAYAVGRLVHDADADERWDEAVRDELRRWTGRGADADDGIPVASAGPAADDPSSLVRDVLPTVRRGRRTATFEHRPTLAVLLTPGDEVQDWLVAGAALERVWLESVVLGLGLSLLMQPLELPGLRWLVRPVSAAGRPQAVLRLGVPVESTPPTPRRPVASILLRG